MSSADHIIQPRHIRLEASTTCQLNCPSCPTASGEIGRHLGTDYLTRDDFERLIAKNPVIAHVELSNWGESLLNPELRGILRCAYRRNVALYAGNGVNLNAADEQLLRDLVRYKVRAITCSIDGVTQETYSRYRVGGDYQTVMDNIQSINHWKRHYASRYPLLRWQFIAFDHNTHEIPRARELAEELEMEFFLKLPWEDLYGEEFSSPRDRELIRKESGLGVANRREYREKYGREYAAMYCCTAMWKSPQINHDGRLLGCGVNYWGDYGNVFHDGLAKCVGGEKINYARAMLMGRQPPRDDIPCVSCDIYHQIRAHGNWVRGDELESECRRSRKYISLENKWLGADGTERLADVYRSFRDRFHSVRDSVRREGVWGHLAGMLRRSAPRKGEAIGPGAHELKIPFAADDETGWTPRPVFYGHTSDIAELCCHVSALKSGQLPHPPHSHQDEEVLLMLAGEAELVLPGLAEAEGRVRVGPGEVVYYPAEFPHSLRTTSAQPANYLMFKWTSGIRKRDDVLDYGCYDLDVFTRKTSGLPGCHTEVVFQGMTQMLSWLHCHTSTLSPGEGYDPHSDPYDVVIVVLQGEVETLGETVGENQVIFYPAGEPHGMQNAAPTEAHYMVLEFHG